MKKTYDVIAEVNPCAMVPKMGEVINELNRHMQDFDSNFPAVGLRSTVTIAQVTANRELAKEEIAQMLGIMQNEFDTKLPAWDVRITDFKMQ